MVSKYGLYCFIASVIRAISVAVRFMLWAFGKSALFASSISWPRVEPLEPVPSDKPKATIREQLAAHSTNATCASCHATIDPLGLALDNFDAIGRWRTHERVEGGTGDDPPVDASGTLPDGRSFAGPAEFKRLLAESPDTFARAFVEQLATYALRRVMTVDDAAALDAIAAQSAADGYRLKSLVRALAVSDLFKRR